MYDHAVLMRERERERERVFPWRFENKVRLLSCRSKCDESIVCAAQLGFEGFDGKNLWRGEANIRDWMHLHVLWVVLLNWNIDYASSMSSIPRWLKHDAYLLYDCALRRFVLRSYVLEIVLVEPHQLRLEHCQDRGDVSCARNMPSTTKCTSDSFFSNSNRPK